MDNYRQVVVAYSIKHGQRPDGWWFVVEIPGRPREEHGPFADEDSMLDAKLARMEELEGHPYRVRHRRHRPDGRADRPPVDRHQQPRRRDAPLAPAAPRHPGGGEPVTTTTPTPWPTRDQVIEALGTMGDRGDLHPNWRSVLGRLRQDAERHTALRAARELLERQRPALVGETGDDPARARPSGSLAVFDAIAKVATLETMALCAYACCAQAALEQVAIGAAPASWSEPLPGEQPRLDGDGEPLLPEPGEGLGDLRVPEALAGAPGVDLLHVALRQFNALEAARREWDDAFGCNEWCDELEREMDRAPEYLADYADAAAWTLIHGLRERLRAPSGAGA